MNYLGYLKEEILREEVKTVELSLEEKELIDKHRTQKGAISDGYHTFDELYEHRYQLFMLVAELVTELENDGRGFWVTTFKANNHSDGQGYDGWFLAGIIYRDPITEIEKQITYHLPFSKWTELETAQVYDISPYQWDGHTSQDVITRLDELRKLIRQYTI